MKRKPWNTSQLPALLKRIAAPGGGYDIGPKLAAWEEKRRELRDALERHEESRPDSEVEAIFAKDLIDDLLDVEPWVDPIFGTPGQVKVTISVWDAFFTSRVGLFESHDYYIVKSDEQVKRWLRGLEKRMREVVVVEGSERYQKLDAEGRL